MTTIGKRGSTQIDAWGKQEETIAAPVKVRAAECVMNHSSQAIEIEDVEFWVAELERAAESQKRCEWP